MLLPKVADNTFFLKNKSLAWCHIILQCINLSHTNYNGSVVFFIPVVNQIASLKFTTRPYWFCTSKKCINAITEDFHLVKYVSGTTTAAVACCSAMTCGRRLSRYVSEVMPMMVPVLSLLSTHLHNITHKPDFSDTQLASRTLLGGLLITGNTVTKSLKFNIKENKTISIAISFFNTVILNIFI